MFSSDADEDEDGFYQGPEEFPTREELEATVQILLFLEHELSVDVRRIRVKVRAGVVHLQGSVQSHALRKEIEAVIPTRPGISSVSSYLSVDETK